MANNSGIKNIFKSLVEATTGGGGQDAGKLELAKTSVEKARAWAKKNYPDFDLDKEIPNFDKNYEMARKKAVQYGKTKRKDMPVIPDYNVKKFQQRLKDGYFDIRSPFASETDLKNPFPEGLRGEEAKKFLKRGLKDGSKEDDMVKVAEKKIKVKDLLPIQQQIYVDICLGETIKSGVEGTKKFISQTSYFIVSSDNKIIDGHHRFLSGMMVDPNIAVQCMVIDLPIVKLLPLSTAYGDAKGEPRNK